MCPNRKGTRLAIAFHRVSRSDRLDQGERLVPLPPRADAADEREGMPRLRIMQQLRPLAALQLEVGAVDKVDGVVESIDVPTPPCDAVLCSSRVSTYAQLWCGVQCGASGAAYQSRRGGRCARASAKGPCREKQHGNLVSSCTCRNLLAGKGSQDRPR